MSEPRDENDTEAPSGEGGPDAPEAAASSDAAPADERPDLEAAPRDHAEAPSDEAAASSDTAPAGEPRDPAPESKDEAAVSETPGEAPKRKPAKKKRKKKVAKAALAVSGEAKAEDEKAPKPLPGLGTPDGEKLARALRAFEAGNYALVRSLASELEQAQDPEVKEHAKGLRRRTDVDPVQIVLLVACLALFLVIAYVYVLE